MDTTTFSASDSDSSSASSSQDITRTEVTFGQKTTMDSPCGGRDGRGHFVLVGGGDIQATSIESKAAETQMVDDGASRMKGQTDIFQAFQTITEGKMDEFMEILKTMSTQMMSLQVELKELKYQVLKENLYTSNLIPGTGYVETKTDKKLIAEEHVLKTPKKLQQHSMRLDVTPVSSAGSDVDQQIGSAGQINSKRSLEFSKVQESAKHNNQEALAKQRDLDSTINVPTPSLSLVDIKSEPIDPIFERSSNQCQIQDVKPGGLLMLANAALKHSPEITFLKNSSYRNYDSGMSSGSSCRGSPSIYQDERQATQMGQHPAHSNINSQRGPLAGSSGFSSASPDVKLRKRKKAKEPLPCTFCGKCFNNQSSLRQHESFHRPVRPYKCENEKCDKAYKTRSELNRHLVVHSGEKKHECKLCAKRFLRKQYLKTHLLRHHETGIAMVAPSAMDSFKDDKTGSIPSIIVSSSFVSQTEPLTWRCQMCFKFFVDNNDLVRHVRSYHEKKKPVEAMSVNVDTEERKMVECA